MSGWCGKWVVDGQNNRNLRKASKITDGVITRTETAISTSVRIVTCSAVFRLGWLNWRSGGRVFEAAKCLGGNF